MKLSEHLKQNGITLTTFAASIGEKVTTVHGWISGRRNPGLVSLVAIECATNGAVRPIDFVDQNVGQSAPTSPESDAKAA